MRLADFIRAEIEPILQDWEEFAKTILHASHMGSKSLRDHARDMLLVIADDLESHQNEYEQEAKSKGCGPENREESWAEVHGGERQISGFTVILTGAKQREGVGLVAQSIIDTLSKPFQIAQQSVRISASIGIAFYPQDASTTVALLGAADQAMYKAKKSGSNRISFIDTSEITEG